MVLSPSNQETLAELLESLVGEELRKPDVQAQCASESRGPHFKCIIGYQRQYRAVSIQMTSFCNKKLKRRQQPALTAFHLSNQDQVEEFIAHPLVQRIRYAGLM
jgi:hypothetical protein